MVRQETAQSSGTGTATDFESQTRPSKTDNLSFLFEFETGSALTLPLSCCSIVFSGPPLVGYEFAFFRLACVAFQASAHKPSMVPLKVSVWEKVLC
jgi:hypothetical protein